MIDEESLIKFAQEGDLNPFNHLVLIHQDSLFNLSFRILNDFDMAMDSVQSALISAFQNINQFRGGSFKAWLMRMVANKCLDEIRRQKRHPTVSLEPVIPANDEEYEPPLAEGLSPFA